MSQIGSYRQILDKNCWIMFQTDENDIALENHCQYFQQMLSFNHFHEQENILLCILGWEYNHNWRFCEVKTQNQIAYIIVIQIFCEITFGKYKISKIKLLYFYSSLPCKWYVKSFFDDEIILSRSHRSYFLFHLLATFFIMSPLFSPNILEFSF